MAKSPVKPRRPEATPEEYSLYFEGGVEDVRRFYRMNWPPSRHNAITPVNGYDFYHCFGAFRLAVILQQIYYRYYHGQTKDKRFEILAYVVQSLEKVGLDLIDKSRL